ncbi:MAG: aromatic aminobenezylarsenical efflux permease ArsG family transporter [Gemmatimonadota bacterium]
MTGSTLVLATALWLGLLTAVSPCPLATNVLALGFVSRSAGRPREALLAGLFYAAGRSAAYVLISGLVIGGLLAVPQLSDWLQHHMNRLLGPLLIVVGLVLTGLLRADLSFSLFRRWGRTDGAPGGLVGAALLGFVFALSFCPVSAVLFFGSLVPLAVSQGSGLGAPLAYGLGTALPVLVLGWLIALGLVSVPGILSRVQRLERWLRIGTGGLFLAVGLWYTLVYAFGV